MSRDGKARDERLQRMENRMKETETQVRKNNNKVVDGSDIFGSSNFCHSIATASNSNKINKDEISRELRNTIRAKLTTKDSNVRREHKLTNQTKLLHFMDILRSELSIADLLYIIDQTVKATVNYDEDVIKTHKCKVRDIIINRIDQTYHAKVVEIQATTIQHAIQSFKEKSSVFIDRFEDVIRAYNNLFEVENLPETEKKDAFYNAVVNAVLHILNIF